MLLEFFFIFKKYSITFIEIVYYDDHEKLNEVCFIYFDWSCCGLFRLKNLKIFFLNYLQLSYF